MPGQPGLRDLHLRFHRQAQGRVDHPPQRTGADPLVAAGVQRRRHPGRAGLDLGVLRPVGVGDLRHPGQRWLAGDRPQRAGAARAGGPRSGAADQQRALGDQRTAARRADSRGRAHHQPGWRAAQAVAGRCAVPAAGPGACLRPVRPIGRHHLFHLDPPRSRWPGQHRPATAQHPGLPARQPVAGSAGRHRRRAVPGRCRHHSRLPDAPRAHRRALRAQPVLCQWRTPVPHWRPDPLRAGGRDRVRRAHRPSSEDPWVPHRTGRDRGVPAAPCRRARSRGHRPPGRACPATGGLRGAAAGRAGNGMRRGADAPARNPRQRPQVGPGRLHDPKLLGPARSLAADAQWQAGSQGTARPARQPRAAGLSGPADNGPAPVGGHLASRAQRAAYRPGRQLLRTRRRLYPVDAGGQPRPSGGAAFHRQATVRAADRTRAGRRRPARAGADGHRPVACEGRNADAADPAGVLRTGHRTARTVEPVGAAGTARSARWGAAGACPGGRGRASRRAAPDFRRAGRSLAGQACRERGQ
ncbi:hypothetical protein D3C76_520160 [compost metagenome]